MARNPGLDPQPTKLQKKQAASKKKPIHKRIAKIIRDVDLNPFD